MNRGTIVPLGNMRGVDWTKCEDVWLEVAVRFVNGVECGCLDGLRGFACSCDETWTDWAFRISKTVLRSRRVIRCRVFNVHSYCEVEYQISYRFLTRICNSILKIVSHWITICQLNWFLVSAVSANLFICPIVSYILEIIISNSWIVQDVTVPGRKWTGPWVGIGETKPGT